MKTRDIMVAVVVMLAGINISAAPTADNFHAVTNDWWNGNFTNVYELAQQRLAANTNDLVAAHIMWEYDMSFSCLDAMSNSAMRLVRIADGVTHPALSNLYSIARSGMLRYVSSYAPSWTEAEFDEHHRKSLEPHQTMNCDFMLEIISENGLWTPLGK